VSTQGRPSWYRPLPMPAIHIRGGRLIDPRQGTDDELDVIVQDGRVARIGKGLDTPTGALVCDARGKIVAPGLVDLHAHLREPGEEGKETIETGSNAAASGGFTTVCAMPNTHPPNDCRAITMLVRTRARELGGVRVLPVGAITRGLQGEQLADFGELKEAGVVALSDDGRCVMNARLMRRALEYGRTFDLPIVQHAEDHELSRGGAMNEGAVSTRAGIPGQPAEAEEIIVARDLILVEMTGARYHVAHASTARTVAMVREAKARGLPVTCEVTPHHLTLTDEACAGYDTSTKMYPPLRTQADVDALAVGLADGTIDAIATDHAPHSKNAKQVEFDCAAFGVIGLETALSIALSLVASGALSLRDAIERLTWGPARTFKLQAGTMPEGAVADVVVIDPDLEWTVVAEDIESKSKNTPFLGRKMRGRAVLTLAAGAVLCDRVEVTHSATPLAPPSGMLGPRGDLS
jgi:dihydroorotase